MKMQYSALAERIEAANMKPASITALDQTKAAVVIQVMAQALQKAHAALADYSLRQSAPAQQAIIDALKLAEVPVDA